MRDVISNVVEFNCYICVFNVLPSFICNTYVVLTMVVGFAGWLAAWAGWLAEWLAGLAGRSDGWLVHCLVVWPSCSN